MNTSLLGPKAAAAKSLLFFVFFTGELGVVYAAAYGATYASSIANSTLAVAARFKCEVRFEYRRKCIFYDYDSGINCSPRNCNYCNILTYSIKERFCPIFKCPVCVLNGQKYSFQLS
jgi:hypothetical protein